jgi:hypothetical protein
MPLSLEDALLTVYQQALVENRKTVSLEDKSFPVRVTAKRRLRQGQEGGVKPPLHLVDFQYDGKDLRGLEQNPETKSRWAAMARSGKKVMQFLGGGRYIPVVADGRVHFYPRKK